jgi:predicted Zn-dependent protease
MANSPSYYTRGSIEVWDFIRDQNLNYHLGCAIKYICRAGYKDSAIEDLKKAIHYLENELNHVVRSSNRVPKSVQYTELLDFEGETETFDR